MVITKIEEKKLRQVAGTFPTGVTIIYYYRKANRIKRFSINYNRNV